MFVGATRNVLEACSKAGVQRLIYISSTMRHGHPKPRPQPITEDEPLGSRFWLWDHYTRAKVEAERLVWTHHHRTGLPVTVIRPSWIYGLCDRTSIFRRARNLIKGKLLIIGRGRNRLNSVYAGNVAEACLRGGYAPAAGRAYNITNDGEITQQEYMGLFADALGVTPPWIKVPYRLAYGAAFFLEALYRLLRTSNPPWATRYTVWLLGRCTVYSTERAHEELGWQPGVDYIEGIRRTVEWYLGTRGPGHALRHPCKSRPHQNRATSRIPSPRRPGTAVEVQPHQVVRCIGSGHAPCGAIRVGRK